MTTITIPKTAKKNQKLVAIPKEAYDAFLAWQKMIKSVKTFTPTIAEKKAIARGRREMKKGNYVTLETLRHELDR